METKPTFQFLSLLILLLIAIACKQELPKIEANKVPIIPPHNETLKLVHDLPKNAAKDYLIENMKPLIRSIQKSAAKDLSSIEKSFKILRQQPKIVSALTDFYKALPDSNDNDLLLCVKVLGALKRADALPILVSLVDTSITQKKNIETLLHGEIRKRAVRGIAHLQLAEGDRELMRIIETHPAEDIKKEATWAYIWQNRYSIEAIKSVQQIVPANWMKWLYLPRYYRSMNPKLFDKQVRNWRKNWVEIKDPNSPIQTDDVQRGRIGASVRCNHDILDSDSDIWPITHQVGNFREWFAHQDVFNLPEDDWKSGWGYKQTDDINVTFPFNKMLTASFLLTFGLEEMYLPCHSTDFSCEELWLGVNVTADYSNPDFRVFTPEVTVDNDGILHVFAERAYEGTSHLIHYSYSPEMGWEVENVSLITPIVSAQPVYFYQPKVLIENNGTIHVFLATNFNELIHYKKVQGGSWDVENVTSDKIENAPPFAYIPVILQAPFSEDGLTSSMQPTIHVFSVDNISASYTNPPRLVHYRLSNDGLWNASKVLENSAPSILEIVGINKCPNSDRFYLIADNFGNGLTEFTWQRDGWTHENLYGPGINFPIFFRDYWLKRIVGGGAGRYGFVIWSKSIAPDPIVGMGPWSYEIFFEDRNFWIVRGIETYDISTAYPKLHVFATNFDAELIHFWRTQEGNWHEDNLTEQFGHHMWVPYVSTGSANNIHVFSDFADNLVHYYWSKEDGWKGEKYMGNVGIDGIPVVINTVGNDLHVLSYNEDLDLVHYTKRGLEEISGLHWPWHTRDYYARQAQGAALYKHVPRETVPEGVAASQYGLFGADQVEMSCLSFENHPNSLGVTGAACRAAVMIHESVHQRYADHTFATGGMPHDSDGDDWYSHGVYWGQVGVGIHSPIQLQIEFLSDIAEFPAGWVPFSVYSTAADHANNLIESAIKDSQDPGWRCGDLRPFP